VLADWLNEQYELYSAGKSSDFFNLINRFPVYVSYRRKGKLGFTFHIYKNADCFTKLMFNPPWNYGQYSDTWSSRESTVKKSVERGLIPCGNCYYEIVELVYEGKLREAELILKKLSPSDYY
jgi:hypothetical protein